jgi:quercetin dioxygenase-like cupin family protein
MEILPKQPTRKGTPDIFIGDVWLDQLTTPEPPSRMKAAIVRFAPGARNAWHAHALGQTLHVLDGVGLTQSRGEDVVEIHAGETIHARPGEWHWHGAAPDHFMTHLAMWEAPEEGKESEWGEHVTDVEYLGRDVTPEGAP